VNSVVATLQSDRQRYISTAPYQPIRTGYDVKLTQRDA
jgi:hypothetical protein